MIETKAQLKKEHKTDSVYQLDEVEISKIKPGTLQKTSKIAGSVDDFLAQQSNISFIKRGEFGWEPLLNNMSSERTSITLDGMHIFGACTDKMDPVTSYIELNNLSSIDITSGQEGSLQGATIGGSIDLRQRITPFGLPQKWFGGIESGFEANNKQRFVNTNLSYSSTNWVTDATFTFRKAGNYSDGKANEILHSSYEKINSSFGAGYKTGEMSSLRARVIFDEAKNVGFPALPMDLWLSRALITSVGFEQNFKDLYLKKWDTKVYFNTMEHYMDDTKRPENLVHMDMPGWSTTYGMVSKATFQIQRLTSDLQFNTYQNVSIAEMTMYPRDRSHKTMFAYSWPWVTTRFASVAVNNSYEIDSLQHLLFGGSIGMNAQHAKYIEFNRIFYPESLQQKNRSLPALFVKYNLQIPSFLFEIGTGYGQRAPSVSEAYGYYIFNSFDRYDYIGNPGLKNESSWEWNAKVGWRKSKIAASVKANYFFIQHYIVGKILAIGSPMNYQSVGVKGYVNLQNARLFNMSFQLDATLLPNLESHTTITYARAWDDDHQNLPFIRPLSYQTHLNYQWKKINLAASWNGDLKQSHFSKSYGEDLTAAFYTIDGSCTYSIPIRKVNLAVQLGVENLLNRYYTTYADWGNIPRKGRNIYTSLKINF